MNVGFLLNKKAVRNFALGACKERYKNNPAYMPTRVSKKFFDDVNAWLQAHIAGIIEQRPSKGVTL